MVIQQKNIISKNEPKSARVVVQTSDAAATDKWYQKSLRNRGPGAPLSSEGLPPDPMQACVERVVTSEPVSSLPP